MKKNQCHIPKQFLDKFIALELDLLWKNYGTMEKKLWHYSKLQLL